jgi:hypothetical protein
MSLSVLPHGRRDFLRQIAIWLGFVFGYEVARALAHADARKAFQNAERVVAAENHLGALWELHLQRAVLDAGSGFVELVDWTYWVSQFVVVSACLLWVHLRHNRAYPRLRNTLFVVNTLGLIGYVVLPTAPPRLMPRAAFIDTVAGSGVTFRSGLVEWLASPYAAMPSLHAADALVVAVALAAIVASTPARMLVFLWPVWVWFCVLASGSHFWLDVAAGIVVAVVGLRLVMHPLRPQGPMRTLLEGPCAGQKDESETVPAKVNRDPRKRVSASRGRFVARRCVVFRGTADSGGSGHDGSWRCGWRSRLRLRSR